MRFLRRGGHAARMACDETPDRRRFVFDRPPAAGEEMGERYRRPARDAGRTQAAWTTTCGEGGQSHNNMPPYLAVYMWRRVS